MTIGESRKAVSLVLTGLPVWGAAATAENGIDRGEWWALVSLLMGAVVVWITPNDKTPQRWNPPVRQTEGGASGASFRDAGSVNWSLIVTVALVLLLLHWFGVIPPR